MKQIALRQKEGDGGNKGANMANMLKKDGGIQR